MQKLNKKECKFLIFFNKLNLRARDLILPFLDIYSILAFASTNK